MTGHSAVRRGGLAATLLLLAVPAAADWRASFRDGVKASDQQRWEEVARHMKAAIAERPSDDKDKVAIFSNRFLSYIPNAYLGMALAELGRCEEALPYFDQADVQRVAPDREPQVYKPMLQVRGRCVNQLMAGATEAAEKALAAAQRAATALGTDATLAAAFDAHADLEQRRQQALAELRAANEGAVEAIQQAHLGSLRQAVRLAESAEEALVALRRDAASRRDSGAVAATRQARQEAEQAIGRARSTRDELAGQRRQRAADAAWRSDQALARGEREAGEQLAQAEALLSRQGAGADEYRRAAELAGSANDGYDRVSRDLRALVSRGQRAQQEAGELVRRLEAAIAAAERAQSELRTARERPEVREIWARTTTLGGREQRHAADLERAQRTLRDTPGDLAAVRSALDLATTADRAFRELANEARTRMGTDAGPAVRPPVDPGGGVAPEAGPVLPPPALREAVDAYFRGQYPRTLELLESLDAGALTDGRVQAQAQLFRAAASFALFSLDGDDARRRAALAAIGRAKAAAPGLQPSEKYFPPPFLELFRNGGSE